MTLQEQTQNILSRLPQEKGLHDWNVIFAYRGSIAHNTYLSNNDPNSIDDVDLIGVCIPSLDHYFGTEEYGSRGTVEIKQEELDIVIYEFKKMVHLLAGCNPNVLNLLYLRPEYYLKVTPAGQMLLDNRDLFLSKQAYHKYTAYAKGQFDVMTKNKFSGYMGQKRKEIVLKFGFDLKNASHLIRLLRMGKEILESGQVIAYRETDRDELIAIKTGHWSFEEVQAEALKLFKECDELVNDCQLPERADKEKVNELCVSILKAHFG